MTRDPILARTPPADDQTAAEASASGNVPAAMPPLEPSPHPWLRCYVTDDSPRFAILASRFLGIAVRQPEVVLPDVLYANMSVVAADASPL